MKKSIIFFFVCLILTPVVYARDASVYCAPTMTCIRSDFLSCNVLYPWNYSHKGSPNQNYKGTYPLYNMNMDGNGGAASCYYRMEDGRGFTVSDFAGQLTPDRSNPDNRWQASGAFCKGADYLFCPFKFVN